MTWNKLKELAINKLISIPKPNRNDYISRLKYEIGQIEMQAAEDYWINLYESQKKYEDNKNGLVLPFLLDITHIDPITHTYCYKICEEGKEGETIIITLEDGRTIEIPLDATVRIGNNEIKASDLKIGDEV